MQVKVSESSACERTLEVVVEQQAVDGAYERAFGKAAKSLALPGFRRGKVPVQMAKKYINDANLGRDVVEDLAYPAFQQALNQEKLNPISEPKMELVQSERGRDMIFKVSFEVIPHIDVQDYKAMTLTEEKPEVAEADIEEIVSRTLEQHAKVEAISEARGLKEEDFGLVDYTSRTAEGDVDGGSASDYLMHLNRDQFIPGFIDNLVGLEPGAEKDFEIAFPEEYPNPALAGKTVQFHFKLHEIREKRLPELTDEFVQGVSPSQTVADFRDNIRTMLESNTERILREKVAGKLIDTLLEQVSEETVPKSLHGKHTAMEARQLESNLAQNNLPYQEFLRLNQLDHERLIGELQKAALHEARTELLLESIARNEGLHVTSGELDVLIENEARNRRTTTASLRKEIEKQGTLPVIRYRILKAKVMDFLYDGAELTFVPVGSLPTSEATPTDETAALDEEKESKPARAPKAAKAAKESTPEQATGEAAPEGDEAKAPKARARKSSPAKKKEEES